MTGLKPGGVPGQVTNKTVVKKPEILSIYVREGTNKGDLTPG